MVDSNIIHCHNPYSGIFSIKKALLAPLDTFPSLGRTANDYYISRSQVPFNHKRHSGTQWVIYVKTGMHTLDRQCLERRGGARRLPPPPLTFCLGGGGQNL